MTNDTPQIDLEKLKQEIVDETCDDKSWKDPFVQGVYAAIDHLAATGRLQTAVVETKFKEGYMRGAPKTKGQKPLGPPPGPKSQPQPLAVPENDAKKNCAIKSIGVNAKIAGDGLDGRITDNSPPTSSDGADK